MILDTSHMLESSNAGNPELATAALTTQAAVRTPQRPRAQAHATLLGFSEIKNRTEACGHSQSRVAVSTCLLARRWPTEQNILRGLPARQLHPAPCPGQLPRPAHFRSAASASG